jgi:hypothetical protein
MTNPKSRAFAVLLAALSMAVVGCGTTTTTNKPDPLTKGEHAEIFNECKKMAEQGHGKEYIGTMVGAYVAVKHWSGTPKDDAAAKACADGAVAGGL